MLTLPGDQLPRQLRPSSMKVTMLSPPPAGSKASTTSLYSMVSVWTIFDVPTVETLPSAM